MNYKIIKPLGQGTWGIVHMAEQKGTGRVVAISAQIEHDDDYPVRQYDRILFNPKNGIPVDFEGDNRLFVIPIDDVVAVFRKQ